MRLCQLAVQVAAIGLLFFAVPVYGHAVLLSVTPGMRATVRGPTVPIQLRFNSRIDQKRSTLKLIGPNGVQHALAIGDATSPDVLASNADGLASGTYLLEWQVLAADGHITRGEVQFTVK